MASEQPVTLFTYRFPNSLDPLARVLCQLDASATNLGPAPCITGQLQPLDGRRDGASLYMKGRRQAIDRRRSPEQQHRHARQVPAVQGEDVRRDIIKGSRLFLKAHNQHAD
jgi:hypothetical protein